MHSIRTKITALSLAAILVSILAIGGIGIAFIRRQGYAAAANEAKLLCDSYRKSMDKYLLSLEQSVDIVASYAGEALEGVDFDLYGIKGATGLSQKPIEIPGKQKQRLNAFLKNYIERVEPVFRGVANYTNGLVVYYFRINPELSDSQRGFIYSRIHGAKFRPAGMTDIFSHAPDDTTHVGWYYPPVQRGEACWIAPYYNQNLGMDMVSYVSPVYHQDTFVGVVGMDITRHMLTSRLENIGAYETGYACLLDEAGTVCYHPRLETGTNISAAAPEIYEAARGLDNTDDVVLTDYIYQGVAKKAAAARLENGLRLIIIAPLQEINASWLRVIRVMIYAALVLMALFGIAILTALRRLTDPLRRLAEASEQLAAGRYDLKLETRGDDEVARLTRSFQHLVNHLRIYISDLNSKAYRDAMTGVRNKAAFESYCEELNQSIQAADPKNPPRFGVVMMDCNELKEINDAYGHDKGDLYLQSACKMICATFAHSPVFRVGGDEFVALLQNADYDNRDALVADFERRCRAYDGASENPWEHASIATGMAVFDPLVDESVESVFRRADERMYLQKKRAKKEHE